MKARLQKIIDELSRLESEVDEAETEVAEKLDSAEDRNREDHVDLWTERQEKLEDAKNQIEEARMLLESFYDRG